MKLILAVLAFAVTVNADPLPEYEIVDNECTRAESAGKLSDLVGKSWVHFSSAEGLNCTTVAITEIVDGVYNAVYGPFPKKLLNKYGHHSVFVEDQRRPGHFELFLNGNLTSTMTIIGLIKGKGYKNVACDPLKDAEIIISAVAGFKDVTADDLVDLIHEGDDMAPELLTKPIPDNCK